MVEVAETDRFLKWKARGLVVLGIILGIVCTSATIKAVHQEQQVVNLVQNIYDKNKEVKDTAALGQKALHVAKAVDVVETATKELGTSSQPLRPCLMRLVMQAMQKRTRNRRCLSCTARPRS